MQKCRKRVNLTIVIVFFIVFIVGIVWTILSFLIPPNKDKMEKFYQREKEDLIIISEYLNGLNYSFISIDKRGIEDGVMFTGAYTRYQKIDDEIVLQALKRMLNTKKCVVIGKNHNTVFFQKWQFLDKDRGIAVSINEEEQIWVEFLIKSEPLSEIGWYYYEADYEKWRNLNMQ